MRAVPALGIVYLLLLGAVSSAGAGLAMYGSGLSVKQRAALTHDTHVWSDGEYRAWGLAALVISVVSGVWVGYQCWVLPRSNTVSYVSTDLEFPSVR